MGQIVGLVVSGRYERNAAVTGSRNRWHRSIGPTIHDERPCADVGNASDLMVGRVKRPEHEAGFGYGTLVGKLSEVEQEAWRLPQKR